MQRAYAPVHGDNTLRPTGMLVAPGLLVALRGTTSGLSDFECGSRAGADLLYVWIQLPTFLGLFIGTTFARAP
jgi:hypothetical protein